jgi:broad specificity polyphosphatase/5'/3'-nucleotidase SurE
LKKPSIKKAKPVLVRGLPVIYNCDEVSNDVTAMRQRYATITPLKFDLTDKNYLQQICDWELKI